MSDVLPDTADEGRRVSCRIVVVQHPSLVFPHFRPLPVHSIPQMCSNFLVKLCLPADHVVQIQRTLCADWRAL